MIVPLQFVVRVYTDDNGTDIAEGYHAQNGSITTRWRLVRYFSQSLASGCGLLSFFHRAMKQMFWPIAKPHCTRKQLSMNYFLMKYLFVLYLFDEFLFKVKKFFRVKLFLLNPFLV